MCYHQIQFRQHINHTRKKAWLLRCNVRIGLRSVFPGIKSHYWPDSAFDFSPVKHPIDASYRKTWQQSVCQDRIPTANRMFKPYQQLGIHVHSEYNNDSEFIARIYVFQSIATRNYTTLKCIFHVRHRPEGNVRTSALNRRSEGIFIPSQSSTFR